MSYVIAWIIYLLSAVGLVLVFWRITRNMRLRRTRRSIRALLAVLMFTPVSIVEGNQWFAPAYLVGGYDWILGNHERAQEAGLSLLVAYVLMITIIFLESAVRRLLGMPKAS